MNATRPRIGITMDAGPADEKCKTMELPVDYVDSIIKAGGLPILLPWSKDPAVRAELLELVDGLLIPGGNDLDPHLYGEEKHPETKLTAKERQDFDFAILALAEQRQLPTLGICMGCQTMNVQRQGTLHQHLPELEKTPETADLQHRKPGDRTNAHDVAIRPQTVLAGAIKSAEVPTNSRHHQGIAKVGRGLVASAYAPDGLVEAVEDPTMPFWVAVQWHPENLFGSPHEGLFRALVEAARKYRDSRPR
jgi:putative glutamine amidotransferase